MIEVGRPISRASERTPWIPDYDEGGQTQLMSINSWYQGLRFTRLERHFDVTQTFVALGPSASAVAVSAPTDASDPDAIPAPDDVRAFLIDKPMGYILKARYLALARSLPSVSA